MYVYTCNLDILYGLPFNPLSYFFNEEFSFNKGVDLDFTVPHSKAVGTMAMKQ